MHWIFYPVRTHLIQNQAMCMQRFLLLPLPFSAIITYQPDKRRTNTPCQTTSPIAPPAGAPRMTHAVGLNPTGPLLQIGCVKVGDMTLREREVLLHFWEVKNRDMNISPHSIFSLDICCWYTSCEQYYWHMCFFFFIAKIVCIKTSTGRPRARYWPFWW